MGQKTPKYAFKQEAKFEAFERLFYLHNYKSIMAISICELLIP